MIAKKNQMFKLAGVVLACAVISACSSSDPTAKTVGNSGTPSAGDADFSNFVAIGDSITAGYADGALYLLGQQNSFPAILAQQFSDIGGGAFEQPLITDPATATPELIAEANLGGLLVGGTPGLIENRFVLNTETETPERLEDIQGSVKFDVVGTGLNGMTFNNMGIPGAKSFHLLAPGYGEFAGLSFGTASPYFARFSSNPTSNTLTLMDDAAVQAPSFYVLWIGNNDVLGFATSGGDGSDSITPTATFNGAYAGIVATMSGANPAIQGVLANIPDVSTLPYFTTVPYNPVPLDQASADQLNAGYAVYNAGLQAALDGSVITAEEFAQRTIAFSEGQNAVVILDEDLTPIGGPETFMRHATANDLIVLPASSKIGTEATPGDPTTVWGLGMPLVDADVLIPSEITAIDTARKTFNATIKAAADADPNLAFIDAEAIMIELSTTGVDFGTGTINADFATGGAFSLDGVHPTARGYALIANKIIDAINTGFNANVYKVDPTTYPAVLLK